MGYIYVRTDVARGDFQTSVVVRNFRLLGSRRNWLSVRSKCWRHLHGRRMKPCHIISYKFNDFQKTTCTSVTSARFYQTTWRQVAKGNAFQIMFLRQIKSTQFRNVTRSWLTSSIVYSLSLTITYLTLTEWVEFLISELFLRGKYECPVRSSRLSLDLSLLTDHYF